MHQTALSTTTAPPENQHAITVKKNAILPKLAHLNTEYDKEIKNYGTQRNRKKAIPTRRFIITKTKHKTDRRNHLTTIRSNGTEKEFIVDTGSPVTIIKPDKETIKNNKIIPITKKTSSSTKMKLNLLFVGTITVEAEIGGIRGKLNMLITK